MKSDYENPKWKYKNDDYSNDYKYFGNADAFKLLYQIISEDEGWMRSADAMFCGLGCIVRVTTQQLNKDGSYAISEALTYVPGVRIAIMVDGSYELMPI